VEVSVPITDLLTGDTIGSLHASLRAAFVLPSAAELAPPSGPLTALFMESGASVVPSGAEARLFIDEGVEWSGHHWLTVRRASTLPGVEIAMAGALDPVLGPFERVARRGALALLITSVFVVLVIVMLTRRMTREVERELAQREALAAVGEFASELSHEVRNPLTAIRLDLQRAEEAAEEPATVRVALARVLRQIDRMDRAVTGALRVARGGSIQPKTVDLREVLESAERASRPEMSARGGRASLDVTAGEQLDINGDAGALEQLFLNLLLNAAQALAPGGSVRVSAVRVNDHVEVRVADEGRGMTAEELGRIERPYRSSRADGNGLGLKIARRVVASHGGTLSISSTNGVGTEVVVRLPV
jgi:signal transduction histidine kinase